MSELKVNSIVDANSGNTTQINGFTPSISNMAGRNRIINGDMRIAQRGTTATLTGTGYFTIDMCRLSGNTGVVSSIAPVTAQSTDAPAGFTNSFLWTNTNAVLPLTGTEWVNIEQRIEGNNIADLSWGTASAKTVTLSFWVRSSLTGNFGGSFLNAANNRSYPFTYSISSSNTWEYKTVTVEGDTTGTWLTDTGIGLRLHFSLGMAPAKMGAAGSWISGRFEGATGQVQLVETAGATWQITGVQLEAGSVATPFERRPFGTELALCQRYFVSYGGSGSLFEFYGVGFAATTTSATILINHPVELRATPTFNVLNVGNLQVNGTGGGAITALSLDQGGRLASSLGAAKTGLTANTVLLLINSNSNAPRLQFSSEL
jgi:hypothetical protein